MRNVLSVCHRILKVIDEERQYSRLAGSGDNPTCAPEGEAKHEQTIEEMLQAYLDLFDDLFFFQSIASKIKIRFSHEKQEGTPFKMGKLTTSQDASPDADTDFYTIEIFNQDGCNPKGNRMSTPQAYIGILLREVTHAFFLCWAHKECAQCQHEKDDPVTGQGSVWQMAADNFDNLADSNLSRIGITLEEALSSGKLFEWRSMMEDKAQNDLEGWDSHKQTVSGLLIVTLSNRESYNFTKDTVCVIHDDLPSES